MRRKHWPSLAWLTLSLTLFGCHRLQADGGDLKGETVSFVTQDGVAIVGTWYPPPSKPAPAVLLLHMLGRNRQDWKPLIRPLHEAGYAVLAIDLRGHGESVQKGTTRLDYRKMSDAEFRRTVNDVRSAFDFLTERPEVDAGRIGIIGASIGANHALRFAAQEEEVKTLVLLSPGLEYHGVATEGPMLRYGERPVLIVASLDDRYSAESSRRLESLARGKKKLKLYERAGHGTRMFAKAPNLVEMILDWLEETL